jgi:hypothetical protein
MTREETRAILSVLKAAYPHFYKDQTKDELTKVLDLWSTMFEAEPAKLVTESVKALLTTCKFPPTIADVKEKLLMLTRPPDLTEQESWNLVYNAIKSANYHAQENFDNLPPILQRLVGSPNQLREWAQMEPKPLEVASSNFMRSYTARVKQEKEFQVLPQSNKQIIQSLSDNFKMSVLDAGEAIK